jgi:hypothetical protein
MSAISRQDELARQASFVFKGTVEKLKAATMPSVPITSQTVVVHVDQVLQAPKILSGYEGKDITVQLSKGSKVKEGKQAIFYTNGWLFGDSIAVQSIGHTDVGESGGAFSADAGRSIKTTKDRDLQEHLAGADLVVRGRVVSVGLPEESAVRGVKATAATTASTSRLSEHSARWNEAIVDVQSVEKGRQSQKRIMVRFPRSDDVAWARAPKLDPGQEGVFILHKPASETGTTTPKRGIGGGKEPRWPSYVALHAEDFLPTDRAGDIKALIPTAPPRKSSKKNR